MLADKDEHVAHGPYPHSSGTKTKMTVTSELKESVLQLNLENIIGMTGLMAQNFLEARLGTPIDKPAND